MSKWLIALICSIGLLVVGGCGERGEKGSDEGETTVSASGAGLRLDVRSEPGEATVMEENVIRLTVQDERGNPVETVTVEVYLVMPGMFCGRIPAKTREVAPGQYELLAVPVMPGKWQAEIAVCTDGNSLTTAYAFKAV